MRLHDVSKILKLLAIHALALAEGGDVFRCVQLPAKHLVQQPHAASDGIGALGRGGDAQNADGGNQSAALVAVNFYEPWRLIETFTNAAGPLAPPIENVGVLRLKFVSTAAGAYASVVALVNPVRIDDLKNRPVGLHQFIEEKQHLIIHAACPGFSAVKHAVVRNRREAEPLSGEFLRQRQPFGRVEQAIHLCRQHGFL